MASAVRVEIRVAAIRLHLVGIHIMEEIKEALLRATGIILMVLGGLAGAATCGTWYGQNHPVEAK